jgi:hypothetical protein
MPISVRQANVHDPDSNADRHQRRPQPPTSVGALLQLRETVGIGEWGARRSPPGGHLLGVARKNAHHPLLHGRSTKRIPAPCISNSSFPVAKFPCDGRAYNSAPFLKSSDNSNFLHHERSPHKSLAEQQFVGWLLPVVELNPQEIRSFQVFNAIEDRPALDLHSYQSRVGAGQTAAIRLLDT